ncbi:MAG: hypothetical protein HYX39_06280 [Bacteroidetes bacterium]|nr:hypothetical protein [Bacteroidota bacterium]
MKLSSLIVVLNMFKLSVPEKIAAALARVAMIGANPTVFSNAAPLLIKVNLAIKALETAWKNAQEGGPKLTAIMHDKEDELMQVMHELAAYVTTVADGDPAIVHLAGFEIKTFGSKHIPDFKVYNSKEQGAIGLKAKARPKALYMWQVTPYGQENWTTAVTTDVSRTTVGDLEVGKVYTFRVVILTAKAEFVSQEMNFAVN